jgi:hypothetical protein
MSEATPEATTSTEAAEQPQEGAEQQEPKTFDAEYVANLRKEAAKYRTEAKAAASELETLRQASLSESERAVEDAEQRGRSAAATEYGKELAQTRFDAIAGRRNPDFDTAQALEFLDLGKFLGEDGRPNDEAIAAAVERLVPAPNSGPPSFDGGARTSAPLGDFNQELRRAAGRA